VSETVYKEQLSDALYYVTLKSLTDDTPMNFNMIRVLASAHNPGLDANIRALYANLTKEQRSVFKTLVVHNENLLVRKMATKAWGRPISEAKLCRMYETATKTAVKKTSKK